MSICLQMRRDSSANWEAANPILLNGEFGYDETNKLVKIGDGQTSWNDLDVLWAPCGYVRPAKPSSSSRRGSSSSSRSSLRSSSSARRSSSSSSPSPLFSSSSLAEILGSSSDTLFDSSSSYDISSSSSSLIPSSSSSSPRQSSSSSAGPRIIITRQPYNNFTGDNAAFSVIAYASTGVPLSYQWQMYYPTPGSPGDYSWQDLAGDTQSTLTLSVQAAAARGIAPETFDLPLRVVLSAGSLTTTTTVAYWRNLTLRSMVGSIALAEGQLNYLGAETISGISYKVYSANSATALVASVLDAGAYNVDTSWFTGPDTTINLQISSNLTTWTTLQAFTARGVPTLSAADIAPPGVVGVRYYRWLVTDNWPYPTTNGSLSTNRTQYRYPVADVGHFKITWSA